MIDILLDTSVQIPKRSYVAVLQNMHMYPMTEEKSTQYYINIYKNECCVYRVSEPILKA